jgi:hypothetical protein
MALLPSFTRRSVLLIGFAVFLLSSAGVMAIVTSFVETNLVHDPVAEHIDQFDLRGLVASGQKDVAFEEAFDGGDELFETVFNALDGVGANVGNGQRFTRVPRADLRGAGEWFNHRPARITGPNANACNSCHFRPFDDGAGDAAANVHRDSFRTAQLGQFIQRNTPHLFAPGAVQRVAEEMTEDLHADRRRLIDAVCSGGGTRSVGLDTKGVSFGTLVASRTNISPCRLSFDTGGVRGVDFAPDSSGLPELVVKPFQWKGSVAFLRDFNRGASHNELGMQSVEITGDNVDGDADGIENELTIGDQTALAVYLAAQPRPTTLLELAALELIEPLPASQVNAINRGAFVFDAIGCDSCHRQSLTINDPVFSEPSQISHYRDSTFPAGQNPVQRGVDPRYPVTFDLTKDQPDNVITRSNGSTFLLGSLRKDSAGRGVVELYSDLKRHDMGPRLAEPVNEIAGSDLNPNPSNPKNRHTPSTFLTEALWGVGSTAPYMHDGRATTLVEAILEHGSGLSSDTSEAANERRNYINLAASDKRALVAFLENLVLFKLEEVEGIVAATVAPSNVTLRVPQAPTKRKKGKGKVD